MGGTEASAAFFATRTADVYQETIDLLLSRGKRAEALHVLERSRARQFLVSLKARALAPALGATDRLDLAGIRGALPKGTLLLSYAVLPAEDRPLRRARARRRTRERGRPFRFRRPARGRRARARGGRLPLPRGRRP